MLLWSVEIEILPEVVLSHEHNEYRWITMDELERIDGWRSKIQEMVRSAFNKLFFPY
jgi:hypothetical protein